MTEKLKVPKAMEAVFDTVAGIIDEFCRKHLNEEYATVSRELAAALCRKRPSPLVKGKPEQWACACVYVIGSANFLHGNAPLELQEEAYQRGLIPFVPGKKVQ